MHTRQIVFDGDGGTVELRDYRENRAGEIMEVTLGHVVFTKRLLDGRGLWDLYRAGSDEKVADGDISANSIASLADIAIDLWRSVQP
jgi:glucokinase